jgi:biotin carboxyl carrier protein
VIAAADLLKNDWGVEADIWGCPSFNELARDGQDAARWNLLHPLEAPKQSHVEQKLAGAEGPVIAATDYIKLFAEQIRPFVKAPTSRWAPTASAVPTPARSCATSSRSTVTGSPWPPSRRWPTKARSSAKVAAALVKYNLDPPSRTRCRFKGGDDNEPNHRSQVPDIGDFADVPVIELFVKVGDTIKVDDAIATLESDKATMDVPSTVAGVVKEVLVQLGSKVSEGAADQGRSGAAAAAAPQPLPPRRGCLPPAPAAAPAAGGGMVEVKVPDIGDFSDVPVIELFVKVGDSIKAEDAIATLESDKATMDVPSSAAGVVKEVLVQLGSKVSEGAV